MSLWTERICRENLAGTESTRHSQEGDIVPQLVNARTIRNTAVLPTQLNAQADKDLMYLA